MSVMHATQDLLFMLVAHVIADYPLQGDWLSKAKNHRNSLIPGETIWPHALAGHAAIHGLGVYLITCNGWLAAAETAAHAAIDYSKCDGRISYNQDQAMHAVCKIIWCSVLLWL